MTYGSEIQRNDGDSSKIRNVKMSFLGIAVKLRPQYYSRREVLIGEMIGRKEWALGGD